MKTITIWFCLKIAGIIAYDYAPELRPFARATAEICDCPVSFPDRSAVLPGDTVMVNGEVAGSHFCAKITELHP